MSSSSVENKVGTAIKESQEFAAIKETSSFDKQIATSSEAAAQAAIGQADAMTQMLQMQRDEVNQQVLNPPMKDVSAGGKSGGMKQVVDNEELGKLQSQLRALDGQLADATNKAEAARSEASEATISRVQLEAEEEAAATGESEALAKASSLRTSLAGEERDDSDGTAVSSDGTTVSASVSAQQAGTNTNATSGGTNENQGTEPDATQKINESTGATSSNTD